MRNVILLLISICIVLIVGADIFAQDSLNITQVGSLYDLWGRTDVVVKDDYAYLLSLNTVRVFDVSNPEEIEQVGSCVIQCSFPAEFAEISGDVLVASWGVCCNVVDISDPTNPEEVSLIFGVNAQSFVFEDGILYSPGNRSHLKIFDLANMREPALLCSLEIEIFSHEVRDIRVLGLNNDILFMEDGYENVIALIDVADPENPEVIAEVEDVGGDHFVVFYGDYAYTNGGNILDFSDLESVFVAGQFEGNAYHEMHVRDHYLYHGKNIYDLTDPLDPELIYNEDIYEPSHRFTWQDDRFYHLRPAGLRIYDLEDPEEPRILGALENPFGRLGNIVVDGDYAYVLDWTGKLRVVDISEPENPYQVGVLIDDFHIYRINTIIKYRDYCYLYKERGLLIVSVENPEDPEVAAYYAFDRDSELYDIVFKDDFAFAAHPGHITVYDASDPVNLDSIHSYCVNASRLCLVDDYLYMDDYNGQNMSGYLKVLDIS
ncbi:MAG: hypothetical protein P9M15_06455, partial [Candidatus Electryoneaceae bacterium]|nr:hypothetical protein [Candidatus Electryoneaceae bacterium]